MIQGFRKVFQSPLGLALTLGFVGLIALAFASADITGSNFGGVTGGERVATVGEQRIATSDLRGSVASTYQALRERDPTLTMERYLDSGALENALDQMIQRYQVYDFGVSNGIRVGDSLIGSELAKLPAFQGADGKFSDSLYRQVLSQRGLSDKLVRKDLEQGLVSRMVLMPAGLSAEMPSKIARRYAQLLNERRHGKIALIPSAAFAADVKVTDEALKKYLAANSERYALPERRTLRFVMIDGSILGDTTKATDAEIAERFKANAALYAASENRSVTQLVMPTEAAAKAVLEEVDRGTSLSAAAKAKGLATTDIEAKGRKEMAEQTTNAVASAVYAAAAGAVVGPLKGPLGWYLLRVDKVTKTPARTLADVRDELAGEIATQKRHAALADRAAEVEERMNDGATIAAVAESLSLDVTTSDPVVASGEPFDGGKPLPDVVRSVVPAVFAMSENSDPQIAAARDGEHYIVYALGTITEAAPPAFAELKPRLERDYRIEQGSKNAKAAAEKVMEAMKDKPLETAMAAAGKRLPPVDTIDLSRQELMSTGRAAPPVLALMFTMAPKTTKKLEAPQELGWFIVSLDRIETRELEKDDRLVAATQSELNKVQQRELTEQLQDAIGADVGATRNPAAIAAVREQLGGKR